MSNRTCVTGKAGYEDKKAAQTVINLVKKGKHRDKIPKRAYWCKECRHWHLTSDSENMGGQDVPLIHYRKFIYILKQQLENDKPRESR